MISNFDITLVVAYLIILLYIGYRASKNETTEGFLIADRNMSSIAICASVAAGFMDAGILYAFTALTFVYGLASMWVYIGFAVAFLLFAMWGKKIRALSDEHKFYTLSDYFFHQYDFKSSFSSAILTFLLFSMLLIVQFVAGGQILSQITGISYVFSIIIIAVIVLAYLLMGGFKSVVKTDLFQFGLVFVLSLIVAFAIVRNSTISLGILNIFDTTLLEAIAFFVIGIFAALVSADIWQRVYAARDKKALRNGMIGAAITLTIMIFATALIGLSARAAFPSILPEKALATGLTHILPSSLLGLGLVLIFAALMSSTDTIVFVMGLNISRDLLRRKNIDPKKLVSYTRYAMLGIIIVAALFATFVTNILDFAFAMTSVAMAMGPAIVGSFYWKLKKNAVFLSLITGTLAVVIMITFFPITPESSVISLPVAFIFLVVGQLFFTN